MLIQTATLGYPRIGKNREVKKALEAFWNNQSDIETLLQTMHAVEAANWKVQEEVIPSLKNMVEAAKILREEAYAIQK
ncbi:methionine synthase II (cobalamin-independent) [Trichothermofontia sp.]